MPASTSETAARLESSIGVSIFSDATAFIGRSLFRVDDASADVPRTTKGFTDPSIPPILTTSRPVCGNAGAIPGQGFPGAMQHAVLHGVMLRGTGIAPDTGLRYGPGSAAPQAAKS